MVGEPLRRLVPLYETPGLEALLNKAQQGELLHWDSTERLTKSGMRVRIMAKRSAIRDEDGKLTGILEKARSARMGGQRRTGGHATAAGVGADARTAMDRGSRSANYVKLGSGPAMVPHSARSPGGTRGMRVSGLPDRHAPPITQHQEALQGKPSHFEYSKKDRWYEVRRSAAARGKRRDYRMHWNAAGRYRPQEE